jgi:NitT/TauT family transport system ATP-binding protein
MLLKEDYLLGRLGNHEMGPDVSAMVASAEVGPTKPRPILRVAGVRKIFGKLEAIRNVTVDIAEGEFVSLLGPTGCGKSTLLMMIAGLTQPTEGEIVLTGTQVTAPRGDVGVVFQSPVLLPWRSVIANVMFPIELLRLSYQGHMPRARELLRMVKLEDFAEALPRQLSGGMRQRTAICRALIHNPSTLLMDEPFSALDAITRDVMAVELMRIWQTYRKTVVFVTHSIREAAFLSDRVLVMGRRPATIIDQVQIDLPRPRQIGVTEEERFNLYVRRLRKSIEASHGD